ncbi:MAG TPA: DUF2141 domain-containing protein [Polyangiaceae bacterium]
MVLKRARWLLGMLLIGASAGATEEGPANNVIEFKMHMRGSKGIVRCGLFERSGWLEQVVKPATAKIRDGYALCVFPRIRPGTYGISAFHDENENGKLDTNFVGMPTEDYCASRNARGVLGPPSFEDAKFQYKGGIRRLEARMK